MHRISKLLWGIIAVVLVACSPDYKILESVESIGLVTDKSVKIAGETIYFTVTTNSGNDITEEANIYVNGSLIESGSFTPTTLGDFEAKAEYLGVWSSAITFRFHDGSETNYLKRVLVEDYTGTWCGNCPRVSFAIERVFEQTSNAVAVGIHRSSSNPADANYDPYNFDSSELEAILNMSGYPKALLNRMTRWSPLEQNNVTQVINFTQGANPKLGLAMDVIVVNQNLQLEVRTQFSQNFSNLRLVVYVLENGLIYDQENYTTFFGGTNPIPNFTHEHVLRACLTPLMGEPIPSSSTQVGQTFTRSFNVPLPANISNTSKMEVVAFITNGSDHKAINVRKAVPGDSQDFETL